MNKLARAVKEFAFREFGNGIIFDSDVLDVAIKTLTPDEVETLELGDSDTDEDQHEAYTFMLWKVFNRHNDICSRYSKVISDKDIEISPKSSITELNIEYKTLCNCVDNYILRICDVDKNILPSLTLHTISDITAAIIEFNINADEESTC